MIDIKELRRLAQAAIAKMNASDPEFASSTPPLAILELLDRLEAAEKSDAESLAMYRRARDERDALKDKIERMEQQRPFAWIVRGGYPVPLENLEWQLLCGAERPTLSWTNQEMRPLYALPGAQTQGEEK